MPGVRETAVVGFTLAVTGGVAYAIWTYVSTGTKPKQDSRKIENTSREETAQKAPEPAQKTPTVVINEAKSAGKQVLVLGLEGAGKTSLLHCFATGTLEQDVDPTQGFNAVSINREDLQIEFLSVEQRICSPTGRGTCVRRWCWYMWWTLPMLPSSLWLRRISTSCWKTTSIFL